VGDAIEKEPAAMDDAARRRDGISEVVPAVLLACMGAYMLLDARSIRIPASEHSIGPRFFPYVVGAAMVTVGICLAVAVLRGDRAEPEAGEDVDADASTDWRTLAVLVTGLVGYILILEPVGYLLSTVVFFGVVAWGLGSRNYRALLLLSVVVPLITYLLFTRALGVYLPNGLLQSVI
jgi:putative tricarboxylic transport membrane protein